MDRKTETPAEVKRRLTRRLQMTSAELAVIALEEVAADKNAPAPARATAGTALLRAAGYFERRGDADSDKQPHEMSAEELQEAITNMQVAAAGFEDDSSVFD